MILVVLMTWIILITLVISSPYNKMIMPIIFVNSINNLNNFNSLDNLHNLHSFNNLIISKPSCDHGAKSLSFFF